jgi:hypothetical protein
MAASFADSYFPLSLENAGVQPLQAFFQAEAERREKKLEKYLKYFPCNNGNADSSKGLYRLPPLEKGRTRLYSFEDVQNVTYVIILNNSTRVCDAGIISKLTGLDQHGSAIKWVAEFESRSVFGRLFRKWI